MHFVVMSLLWQTSCFSCRELLTRENYKLLDCTPLKSHQWRTLWVQTLLPEFQFCPQQTGLHYTIDRLTLYSNCLKSFIIKGLLLLYCTGCSSTELNVQCCTARYCTVQFTIKNFSILDSQLMNLRLRASRRNFFSKRVVEAWDSIPSVVKNSKSVLTFIKVVTEHTDRTWWELPLKIWKWRIRAPYQWDGCFLRDPTWITGGNFPSTIFPFPTFTFCIFASECALIAMKSLKNLRNEA
jgi:hypothetical protein